MTGKRRQLARSAAGDTVDLPYRSHRRPQATVARDDVTPDTDDDLDAGFDDGLMHALPPTPLRGG